jgi:hypothetical protein
MRIRSVPHRPIRSLPFVVARAINSISGLTLLLAATICVSLTLVHAPTHAAGIFQKPAAEREDFALWLVRIQYVHRLDADPESAGRIAELEAKRDAAGPPLTPADRRAIDREIDKAKAESEKRRPHAIYGWSAKADDAGKPENSTRSMTGFILAATDENNKAIAEAQKAYQQGKPAIIALQRERSKDLFTFDGRRWHSVARAAFIKNPADIGEPHSFDIPPSKEISDADRRAVSVSLKHDRSETSDKGSTLHRYWMTIRCDQPPANASRLKLWVAGHVEVDGGTIGPIIDFIEVPRGSKGTFTMSRSFEFIALSGVKMNADATTAQPLAIVWE